MKNGKGKGFEENVGESTPLMFNTPFSCKFIPVQRSHKTFKMYTIIKL